MKKRKADDDQETKEAVRGVSRRISFDSVEEKGKGKGTGTPKGKGDQLALEDLSAVKRTPRVNGAGPKGSTKGLRVWGS